jgi:hypothetical protein
MNGLKRGMRIGDGKWWMAVGIATAATLVVVISIGLASFIDRINPAAIEALAIAMLVTLCLASVYVAARFLSRRSY